MLDAFLKEKNWWWHFGICSSDESFGFLQDTAFKSKRSFLQSQEREKSRMKRLRMTAKQDYKLLLSFQMFLCVCFLTYFLFFRGQQNLSLIISHYLWIAIVQRFLALRLRCDLVTVRKQFF